MKTQMGTAQPDSVTDSTTIEVMLTPQQMKILSKASRVDAMQQHKSRILIGAALAAVLIALGSVAHLGAKPKPVPAPVVQAPPPTPPPPPAEPPAAAAEPVLFKNPFDRTEVFEFPAGTSQQEARAAVASLLMDRAHGRGPDVVETENPQGAQLEGTHACNNASICPVRSSGFVVGANRFTTCRSPLIRNLVKFHFTFSMPRNPGACFFNS